MVQALGLASAREEPQFKGLRLQHLDKSVMLVRIAVCNPRTSSAWRIVVVVVVVMGAAVVGKDVVLTTSAGRDGRNVEA